MFVDTGNRDKLFSGAMKAVSRIHCTNKLTEVCTSERLHRTKGTGVRRVYSGAKCDGKTGSQNVWGQQIYGTYGCNKIERFLSKVIWTIE